MVNILQLVIDAECDLGTEYCQVMKLVYDETITWVPFIVIHTGSKFICLAVENKQQLLSKHAQ